MALEDEFLLDVTKKVLLASLDDQQAILYRQEVLKDCILNEQVVRDIYSVTVETIQNKEKDFWLFSSSRYPHPGRMLHNSIEVLEYFVPLLKRLRMMTEANSSLFLSEGFTRLCAMFSKELDDEYLVEIQAHLRELKFRNGQLISAKLGQANTGKNYVLRKPNKNNQSWIKRLIGKKAEMYSFRIADRDDSGAKALEELQNRGLNLVANALTQSTDHIMDFFVMLRTELAFYIGCLNLHTRLVELGEPTIFPIPAAASTLKFAFGGLYDTCLALNMGQAVTGNTIETDHTMLMIVTGANQGGKTTFLRSLGLSQLMMQCGMFVSADSYSGSLSSGIFTHFKREEDATMKSGKFDEEMQRMSTIVDSIKPDAIIFFNESFSATNEHEGSEIARQIVLALAERGIRVCFVTHQFEFAYGLYAKHTGDSIFLRAERKSDGTRTFRIIEGEPLRTSYGEDLYTQIFETKH